MNCMNGNTKLVWGECIYKPQEYIKNPRRKYIPIYIVKRPKGSFSDPLTLCYKENTKFMLIILIHELLHNNLPKKFKTKKERHLYMSMLMPKIIEHMPLNLKEENKILDEITLR